MRAITRAVLAASFATLLLPTGAEAFSLAPIPGAGNAASVTTGSIKDDRQYGRPVLMAQADDSSVRVSQLSEEVRKLTGQVQDLNYQLLQMQEQMRQMQKDNEFRFQRLEGGSAGGSPSGGGDHSQNMTAPGGNDARAAAAAPSDDGGPDNGRHMARATPPSDAGNPNRGAPPQSLGSMTFDENGNIVHDSVSQPGSNASGSDTGTDMASLPGASSSPQEIYRAAYAQVLNGDYAAAARGFHDYLDVYPDGPDAANATYWLGESEFSQGQFDQAAKTFLNAHQKYPKAEKAPETLLKLGMALAALNNQDTACATYREVIKRYPNGSDELRRKVKLEEKRTGC